MSRRASLEIDSNAISDRFVAAKESGLRASPKDILARRDPPFRLALQNWRGPVLGTYAALCLSKCSAGCADEPVHTKRSKLQIARGRADVVLSPKLKDLRCILIESLWKQLMLGYYVNEYQSAASTHNIDSSPRSQSGTRCWPRPCALYHKIFRHRLTISSAGVTRGRVDLCGGNGAKVRKLDRER